MHILYIYIFIYLFICLYRFIYVLNHIITKKSWSARFTRKFIFQGVSNWRIAVSSTWWPGTLSTWWAIPTSLSGCLICKPLRITLTLHDFTCNISMFHGQFIDKLVVQCFFWSKIGALHHVQVPQIGRLPAVPPGPRCTLPALPTCKDATPTALLGSTWVARSESISPFSSQKIQQLGTPFFTGQLFGQLIFGGYKTTWNTVIA